MNLKNSTHKEVYIFTFNGSREVLLDKYKISAPTCVINVTKSYKGVLKIYFPSNSDSFTCISENKDIVLTANTNSKGKFIDLNFEDNYNLSFIKLQNASTKKKQILPALLNMKSYYPNSNGEFRKAIEKEILDIEKVEVPLPDAILTKYYFDIQKKYLTDKASSSDPKAKELQSNLLKLVVNSDEMLETSALLRNILVQYLSFSTNKSLESDVDIIISKSDLHTSRGQNVLSELLEIFETFEIIELQKKYLKEAKALTCTINDRLKSTMLKTENTMLGSKLPNVEFNLPINKQYKSIYDINSKYKVIIFWSSTCPHCMAELPDIIKSYQDFESRNIKIIGLSIDTDKKSYDETVKNLDWINDTEYKGWNSSFLEKFSITATPSIIIVDENNIIVSKPSNFKEAIKYLNAL